MNRDAVFNMLQMQHRMNHRVHADWISQRFEWYRAVWIECAEFMDHVGYKWWKKQTPEMEQVRLEVVDIWHFGMSALFQPEQDLSELADLIVSEVAAAGVGDADIHSATEALARSALETQVSPSVISWRSCKPVGCRQPSCIDITWARMY